MQKTIWACALLVADATAGCATQTREARCQAGGHTAGSAAFQSCLDGIAAQERNIRSNSLRRTGGPSGG